MSETMIERLARAPYWGTLSPRERAAAVRAVLQALREPSEDAMNAMLAARKRSGEVLTYHSENDARLDIRTYIDHILSEGEPAQPPREREEAR